jgi:hypothetical protein
MVKLLVFSGILRSTLSRVEPSTIYCMTNVKPFGRRLDRKFSEQNIGAPPSYEEAVSESRSPVHSERYRFCTIIVHKLFCFTIIHVLRYSDVFLMKGMEKRQHLFLEIHHL